MKANELMIGDWVEYRGQIIKVTSLYDKGGSNEVGWSDKEDVWVNADNVKPILITKEILEKNGFKKCDGCNQWTLYKPHFYCILCDIDKPYLEIASYNGDIGEFNRSGIRFINELQHALRLCGIEKEIEL